MTADQTWEDGALASGPGLLPSLWRYRLVIVVVTVLAAAAFYGLAKLEPPRYAADAALILRDPGSSVVLGTTGGGTSDLQPYMAKQANIVMSREVLQRAAQLLPQPLSLRDMRRALDVQLSKDLASIDIRATAGDPTLAAALANAVGNAYQQVTAERAAEEAARARTSIERIRLGLQAQLAASGAASQTGPVDRLNPSQQALASQIATLQQREQEISTQAAVYGSGVELFETADKPDAPSKPKPKLYAVLGALLGLVAAGAWAWWAAVRNQRAEDRDDPAPVLGAPLLGEVPEFRSRPPRAGEPIPSPAMLGPIVAEAYHFIVASLEHALASVGGTSVVVTSAAPGDGKTSTVLNVAIAAQQEHREIVLVDADERTRRLSEICGEGDGQGLTDLGDEPVDIKKYYHCLDLTDGSIVLPVLPSGSEPEHPAGFFRTPAFRKALLSIGEQADLVVIDTPALLAVSDTIAIASHADGILLVVNHGVPLSHLRNVRDRLAFTSTPLLGYVFNRSSASLDPYAREYSRGARARPAGARRSRLRRLLGLGTRRR